MKSKPHISILLPVKNEQDNIGWAIERVSQSVRYRFELLIIYDSEDDPTIGAVKRLTKKYPALVLIKNRYGSGVLNAVKTGIDHSCGDTVVIMASDRTDDPKTMNAMYGKIIEGYDVVCATRYGHGGSVQGSASLKSVLSRLAGISTPFILGIPTTDLTYSYKMFRKNILSSIRIKSRGGFEFAEELVIKAYAAGYKIADVPTIWRDRKFGKSKFRLMGWLPYYIYWYAWGVSRRMTPHFGLHIAER